MIRGFGWSHRWALSGALTCAALAWLVVVLAAPAAAVSASNRWTTVPIAQPKRLAQANSLGALFGHLVCVTATDCWTAGTGINKAGGDVPFIEHWDGSAFKLVKSPVAKSFLQGVACATSADCWAAGGAGTPAKTGRVGHVGVGHFAPLLDHYNGSKWSAVHPPNPAKTPDDELADVSCASVKNCYAVGWTRGAHRTRTLIEHWTGKAWKVSSHAALSGQKFSDLIGIDCPSRCMAVGSETATSKSPPHVVAEIQAVRRVAAKHGPRSHKVLVWKTLPMPSPKAPNEYTQVYGMACPALDECLATGSAYSWPDQGLDPGEAVAWHWNGRQWSLLMPKSLGSNQLSDIDCSAKTSCWAVGSTFTDTEHAPAVVASWNGAEFTKSSNDNPYEMDHLDAVGCAADGNCVSVGWGSDGSGVHPFALKLRDP